MVDGRNEWLALVVALFLSMGESDGLTLGVPTPIRVYQDTADQDPSPSEHYDCDFLTPPKKLLNSIDIIESVVMEELHNLKSQLLNTLVMGKVLKLIIEDGPACGLHLNVDKTKVFFAKEISSKQACRSFPPNISWPMHGVKLLGGAVSVDFDFCNELVIKRVAKTIVLMDSVAKINDPQSFEPIFDDALCMFNISMETNLLSNPSEIVSPKLMKKMADIYFTRVTKNAESPFFLSRPQAALWKYQREDYTSDWPRMFPISSLGQTMNSKTYHCVWCYRLGIPLFIALKPCSACSRVFAGDIYEDHVISCAGIIDIKHRHNVVRDTLVEICYRSGISASKEVDIGLDGRSSPLTQTGMVDFVSGRAIIDDAQCKRGKALVKVRIGHELEGIGYTVMRDSSRSDGHQRASSRPAGLGLMFSAFVFDVGRSGVEVTTLQENGASDKDYFNRALLDYEVETKSSFKFHHGGEILKGSSKRMETEIPKFVANFMEDYIFYYRFMRRVVEENGRIHKDIKLKRRNNTGKVFSTTLIFGPKEEEVQNISTSIFVTNFPDHAKAKDLWNVCKQYGQVVDAFIPDRKSKAGKRYGFVRFIRVYDVDRLVSNLCTLWMGSHHLHVNVARFQRPSAVNSGGYTHHNGNYVSKKTEANSNNGSRKDKMSYVTVVNGDTKSTEACEPALLLDDSCLNQLDCSLGLLGKVKEFSSFDNMRMVLGNEGFNDIDLRYMGGMWIMIGFKTEDTKAKFQSCLGATSWFSQIIQASKEFVIDERITWVDIEGIPLKLWSEKEDNSESKDEQSIGFIKEDFDGSDVEKEGDNNVSMVSDSVKEDVNVQAEEKEVECDKKSMGNNEGSGFGNEKRESVSIGSRKSNKIDIKRTGGSVLTVMEELIKVGKTMGYNVEGCIKNIKEIIEIQGEREVFK
nr:DIE2/ALG10 family [Tanacetum cinerariifolium]